MCSALVFLSLVYATTIQPAVAVTSTKQFKHWYPQFGWIFETIVKVNCTAEYDRYLTGIKNHSEIDFLGGGGIYTAITQPLIECILDHTSEYLKFAMTGAQVVLGVMPTIIEGMTSPGPVSRGRGANWGVPSFAFPMPSP